MTMEESLVALNRGVDLQGVCLYPFIDIPDWNSGEWAKIGVCDIGDVKTCERLPHQPYIDELRRWERILDHPQVAGSRSVGGDADGRIELHEVRRHSERWEAEQAGDLWRGRKP